MIEGVGTSLGGFAIDVYAVGDKVSRRVPIKRLRAPGALLGAEPLRIVHARPSGEGVHLVFSDGEVADVGPALLLGRPHESEAVDAVVIHAAAVLTMKEPAEQPLGLIPKGAVAIRGGRVAWVGPEADLSTAVKLGPHTARIDAGGRLVTPGLIDPHTHPVFAGSRAAEFAQRAAGKSYQEIHAAGGGLFSTVRATAGAPHEQLLEGARERMSRMLAFGVTSCEGKSGYALLPEGELALLAVLAEAAASHPVDISPTLLAHAVPAEYEGRRSAYLDLLTGAMIQDAARGALADACDVFCDEGAFTIEETRTILQAAKAAGLALRLHAEQFTQTGAAELAATLGARSADHLERVSESAIHVLARAGVVATLLPGAALTLRLPWPPARRLLDAKARVALGSDLNPGSSMTESLPLMMSLACMQMEMSVEEAWAGVTTNAARALGRGDIGRLVPGARADLCIFSCEEPAYVPYHYGTNHLFLVMKDGRVAVGNSPYPTRTPEEAG